MSTISQAKIFEAMATDDVSTLKSDDLFYQSLQNNYIH